jgi:hypothetical protein
MSANTDPPNKVPSGLLKRQVLLYTPGVVGAVIARLTSPVPPGASAGRATLETEAKFTPVADGE